MVAEFKELVQKSRVRIDEAAWQQDEAFIRAMIRFEIDVDLFGVEAARKNLSTAGSAAPVRADAVSRGGSADAADQHGDRATRREVSSTPNSQIPTPKSPLGVGLGRWAFVVTPPRLLGSQPKI